MVSNWSPHNTANESTSTSNHSQIQTVIRIEFVRPWKDFRKILSFLTVEGDLTKNAAHRILSLLVLSHTKSHFHDRYSMCIRFLNCLSDRDAFQSRTTGHFGLKTESNEFQSSRIGPFEGEARHGSSGTGEDESVGTWECGWRWKELKCVEIATCARRVHSTSRTVHEGIQGSDRYCVGCDWYRWSEKKFVRNGKRDVIVCFWQRRESVWCLWFGFVVWMKCLRSLGRFWSCFVWFRWRVCWMCEE